MNTICFMWNHWGKAGFLMGAILVAVLSHGCASLVYNEGQELTFTSEPSGARVSIKRVEDGASSYYDNSITAETPTVLKVKGGEKTTVTFEKVGFKPQTITLETEGRGISIIGNFLLGGLLLGPFSTSTDVNSGSYYEYKPGSYFMTLEPDDTVSNSVSPKSNAIQDIKQYIIVSYDYLILDANRGNGEYLSSLMARFDVSVEEQPAFIARLKEFAEGTDAPGFADRVVAHYVTTPTGLPEPEESPTKEEPVQPKGLKVAIMQLYRNSWKTGDQPRLLDKMESFRGVLPDEMKSQVTESLSKHLKEPFHVRFLQKADLDSLSDPPDKYAFFTKGGFFSGFEPNEALIFKTNNELGNDIAIVFVQTYGVPDSSLEVELYDIEAGKLYHSRKILYNTGENREMQSMQSAIDGLISQNLP